MIHLALVALGGAIGAGCRPLVNLGSLRLFGPLYPVGMLVVNVVGGPLMRLLAGFFALKYAGGGQNLRLLLSTGILGGFTTFSAFSLDAVLLWQREEAPNALTYVLLSVVLSIGALLIGLLIMRAVA